MTAPASGVIAPAVWQHPRVRAQAAAALELRRRQRRPVGTLTFADFIRRHNAPPAGALPLLEYEHTPRLAAVAQRVCDTFATDADGNPAWTWAGPESGAPNYKRVLVLLPPRYFKSETFSRLLPAYFLRRFPSLHVGLSSYSADLAWKLSGKARERYTASGGAVVSDTDAKKLWATPEGGEMWAAGIDGSITGSGFHLGIMDDPMKPKHARSAAYIDAFRAFYPDTWYNRQEPGAAMVVVMQRLGREDPIDFLYRREVGDEVDPAPEHWHVVVCDEIRSDEPLARYDGPRGLPETCTLEPDTRGVGEVLAPSRFDADEVARQQRAAGLFAAAQRQQRPGAMAGDFYDAAWFGTYGTLSGDPVADLPPGARDLGKDWDTAYTKNEANSASAYVESASVPRQRPDGKPDPAPDLYVTACDWKWLETPELVRWMEALGGPHHIEAKASGKSAKQFLDRARVTAREVPVSGGTNGNDKYARHADALPSIETTEHERAAGGPGPRVYVHASIRQRLLEGERQGLLGVTVSRLLAGGPDLDLSDAFVQARNRHSRPTGIRIVPPGTVHSSTR